MAENMTRGKITLTVVGLSSRKTSKGANNLIGIMLTVEKIRSDK